MTGMLIFHLRRCGSAKRNKEIAVLFKKNVVEKLQEDIKMQEKENENL